MDPSAEHRPGGRLRLTVLLQELLLQDQREGMAGDGRKGRRNGEWQGWQRKQGGRG